MTELVTLPGNAASAPLNSSSTEVFKPLPEAIKPPDPIARREIPSIENQEPIIGQDQFQKRKVPRFQRQRYKNYFSRLKRPEINKPDTGTQGTDQEQVIDFTSRLKDQKAQIPEERKKELIKQGRENFEANSKIDMPGGAFEIASGLPEGERELFLQGVAEGITLQDIGIKEMGGKAWNKSEFDRAMPLAAKVVTAGFQEWEAKKNRPDNVIDINRKTSS